MVERLNRSLLQMIRALVEKQHDWERYLPMVMFAYQTAVHASTKMTPFSLMFGRVPMITQFPSATAFEPGSYSAHLQAKFAELRHFVETSLTEAATAQKQFYDRHTEERAFHPGDLVWLPIPTAGKLDPRWEGDWMIQEIVSPINAKISDGLRTRVVHINRLRHRVIPQWTDSPLSPTHTSDAWQPPQIDHVIVSADSPEPIRRYPQRERRPPDRYVP